MHSTIIITFKIKYNKICSSLIYSLISYLLGLFGGEGVWFLPRQRIPLPEELCVELKRTTEWMIFETLTTQRRLYQPSPDQCTTEGGEVREEK